MTNINILSVVLDYIKGLNKIQIQEKFQITEDEYHDILNRHEDFIELIPVNIEDDIIAMKDRRYDNDVIANLLNLNGKIVNYFANKNFAMKIIKDRYADVGHSKKEMIESGDCNLIFDFYHSGGTETDLVKSGISGYTLNAILNHGVNYNDISDKEIGAYKYIVAKSYDMGIITDDMLECLYEIDEKGIETVKREECYDIHDFTCNMLYHIYKRPELLSDLTFTNGVMEEKTENFIRNKNNYPVYKLKYNTKV